MDNILTINSSAADDSCLSRALVRDADNRMLEAYFEAGVACRDVAAAPLQPLTPTPFDGIACAASAAAEAPSLSGGRVRALLSSLIKRTPDR